MALKMFLPLMKILTFVFSMNILYSIDELPEVEALTITIGTFDGVHLGHMEIINQLVELSKSTGKESLLLTFDPHPRQALGDQQISLLTTLDEKIKLLENSGLNYLMVLPFTKVFSSLTADEFILDFLIAKLKVSEIIIGYDHRFGKGRVGDVFLLRQLFELTNRKVHEIPAQDIDSIVISSTKIRNALKMGQIETANRLLGYNYRITGTVIKGKQLGKSLGFPTANIKPNSPFKLIPQDGVYVVHCIIEGRILKGMMNIGKRPTMNESVDSIIEVHLFDFNADLYDKAIIIELLSWIREEQKFNGKEALITQLINDETEARLWLSAH